MMKCVLLLILTLSQGACFFHKTEIYTESLREKNAKVARNVALKKIYLKALSKIGDANTVKAIGPKLFSSFIPNTTGILEEKLNLDRIDRFHFTLVVKLDMTVLKKAWENNGSVKLLSLRPLLIFKQGQGENKNVRSAIIRKFKKFILKKGYKIKRDAKTGGEAYVIEFNLQEERVVDDLINIILIVRAFNAEDSEPYSTLPVFEKEFFRYTHLEIQKNDLEMKATDLLSSAYLSKSFTEIDQAFQEMRYDTWLKGF